MGFRAIAIGKFAVGAAFEFSTWGICIDFCDPVIIRVHILVLSIYLDFNAD
jgi:hypothetical protein